MTHLGRGYKQFWIKGQTLRPRDLQPQLGSTSKFREKMEA